MRSNYQEDLAEAITNVISQTKNQVEEYHHQPDRNAAVENVELPEAQVGQELHIVETNTFTAKIDVFKTLLKP